MLTTTSTPTLTMNLFFTWLHPPGPRQCSSSLCLEVQCSYYLKQRLVSMVMVLAHAETSYDA